MPAENAIPEQRPPKQASLTSTLVRGDWMLWSIYGILALISVVEMFSASSLLTLRAASASDPVFRHISFILVGLLAVVLFQNASLLSIQKWGQLIYVGGVLLLVLLPVLGTQMKGAQREIFGIQPVELAKLGTMMMLCALITTSDTVLQRSWAFFRTQTELRRYYVLLGVFLLPSLFVAPQNLSSALIICFASLAVLFLGQVRGSYLWRTLLVAAAAAAVALAALYGLYKYMEAHPSKVERDELAETLGPIDRAMTWADRIYGHDDVPLWKQDPSGEKAQEIYSHMALANSYPFGRFLGNSRLRDFLPEAYSDYIFAILFEETGFIGAGFVLLLYLLLLARAYWLSRRTQDVYVRLLMVALPLIMVIQALLHIGVCTGAMFVTGQPLPLMSRGGSSIALTSVSFGLMLALSRIIESEVRARRAADGAALAGAPASRVEAEGVRIGQ